MSEVISQVCDRAYSIAQHFAEPVIEENPEVAKLKNDIAKLQAMNDPVLSEAISIKQKQLAGIEINENNQPDANDLDMYELVAADPDFWEELEPHELRIVLDSLVKQVVVLGKDKATEARIQIEFYR